MIPAPNYGPRANVVVYAGGFLPVWSTDGITWRPTVLSSFSRDNPEMVREFVWPPVYPTTDEALAVAQLFVQAISPATPGQGGIGNLVFK
jgi:hypothetical protein